MRISTVLVALAGWGSAACGHEDVGDCDRAAAEEIVYSADGMVATKGQALVHDSCGNGQVCHSSTAEGSARYGAPVGMDFDMIPNASGWPNLVTRSDEIWQQVESGTMPPSGIGSLVKGKHDWRFQLSSSEQATKLPELDSYAGKSAIRNWLACGAPLVNATTVPDWAHPSNPGTGSNQGFEAIYTSTLKLQCATPACHDSATAAGGISLADVCISYRALSKPGICGAPWIKAGDDASPLIDLLTTRTPKCGQTMPPAPTALLPAATVDTIKAWLKAGAEPPACP